MGWWSCDEQVCCKGLLFCQDADVAAALLMGISHASISCPISSLPQQCAHIFTETICRWEAHKRRLTGFLNKVKLRDSAFRHLQFVEAEELKGMAHAFLKVTTFIPFPGFMLRHEH